VDRRQFLLTSLAGVLAAPLAAGAQQATKVYHLAVLSPVPGRSRPVMAAVAAGLRELGYVEGRNIEIQWSLGDRLPERAAELVGHRPDVVIAISISAALAVRQATRATPIVVLIIGDPIAAGLVESLARPGGNITGVATEITPELAAKQLQLLKEAVPKVRRVAVLLNPDWQPNAARWNKTQEAAQGLRVALVRVETRRADDIERAFASMGRERAEALFVLGDPLFYILQGQIGDLAIRHRLPSMSQYREGADAGGLISYGPNFTVSARRLGTYVDRILKGAKPADLPMEQPTTFELVVNLKTAKALGLTIPPSLLARADQVID
jgi:putative ABC transport system substrate-binding protein